MNLEALTESIKRHEGYREAPYRDSLGLWTVATGKLLDDMLIPRGLHTIGDLLDWITDKSRHAGWLADDINRAVADAEQFVGKTWNILGDARQRVIAEMAYQLGLPRLEQFVKFRLAVVADDFEEAKRQGLDSQWAKQTPARANELMNLLAQ